MMFLTELRPMSWGTPTANQTKTFKPRAAAENNANNQTANQTNPATFQPPVSLCETPDAYQIAIEIPGVSPESIDLVLLNDELTVRGAKLPNTADQTHWHVNERAFGPFERRFRFQAPVQQDGVMAEMQHGLLTIRIAKASESLPKKIQVVARS